MPRHLCGRAFLGRVLNKVGRPHEARAFFLVRRDLNRLRHTLLRLRCYRVQLGRRINGHLQLGFCVVHSLRAYFIILVLSVELVKIEVLRLFLAERQVLVGVLLQGQIFRLNAVADGDLSHIATPFHEVGAVAALLQVNRDVHLAVWKLHRGKRLFEYFSR